MSGSPEELLRSALEKIVFFECRLANLESEAGAARAAAARARDEAALARRREADLEVLVARVRGEHAAALAQGAELAERVRLLEAERERFLGGLVERARVEGAPAREGEAAGAADELAGFIAELRAEIERLSVWKRAAVAAGVTLEEGAPGTPPAPPPPPVPALASTFQAEGRLGTPSREQVGALAAGFATRSERALYESSLHDLASPDAGARRRAADCLGALGSRAATPVVAAAIGREEDADVKCALLDALAAVAEPAAAELAARELADARAAVRAAALEATARLAGGGALPHLARALADPSPLVRRRSAMLLGFARGEAADDALAAALGDRDPGVARAAAAALAGRPSARAQGALARALDHRLPEVRQAAARAVERWSGEAVDATAPGAERRRAARRVAERLLGVGAADLRSAVMRVSVRAAALAQVAPTTAPRRPACPSAAAPAAPAGAGPVAAAQRPTGVPAALATVAAGAGDPHLAAAAVGEVRAALRGRTAEELAAALARDRSSVDATLSALVAEGRLVARGPRFFAS